MYQYPGQDFNASAFGNIPNLQLPWPPEQESQRKRPLTPIRPPPSPEHQYTANDDNSGPPRKRPRTPVPCNDQTYYPPSVSPNYEYLSASRVPPCRALWPESPSHSFDPVASQALSGSTPSTPSTEASYGYYDTPSTFSPGNTISTSEQTSLTHTSTEFRSFGDIKANNTLEDYYPLNCNEAITASQTTANFETLSLQSSNDFIPRPSELEADTLGHKKIQIDQQTICIGRITSGAIVCDSSLHHQGGCLPIFLSTDSTKSIDERLPFFLDPEPSASSSIFGYLDERPSKIVKPLLHRKLVQIQALLDLNPSQGQQSNKNYPVYLNIYVSDTGVRVKGLGEFFVTNRVWLQHPVSPVPDIPYRNPHFLCRPGTTLNTSKFPSLTPPESGGGNYVIDNESATREDNTLVLTEDQAKGDLEGLFDSLCQQSQVFGHIEQDSNIITPLLPHQKDAVYFMIQRERPQAFDEENSCFLWKRIPTPRRDGQYLYHNRITGKMQSCIPRQTLGGLLADHMGLGKTLSILSLIVHTLPDKLQNLEKPHQRLRFNEQQYSRTTLVITTKSVLPQWEQQLEQHIRPGTLKSLSYFGSQRQISPEQIVSQDVVFTTYDIVSHEWRKRLQQTNQGSEISTLHSIPWYRVVLDEAHNIRNRNTDRAKAIKELHAERRWCVTGTPIQNSMDDIAGLLLFLRFEPFDNYDTFRDYIRTPLERGNETGVKALRTLIDSLTLRRVKGTVKLPQRTMYTKYVELRSHERKLYDKYLQQSKYFLDKAILTPGTCNAKTALEIILSLRLICDHGQDLLSSSKETYRDLMEEDIKAETQREIDADEITNPITLYQELCFEPSQSAPSLSPSPDPQEDTVMLDRDAYDEPIMGSNLYQLQLTSVKDHASSPKCQPKFPDYSGPSSKVRALLSILQNPKEEWKHSNGPIKSVVFSVWTRMLDLVGIALSEQGIKFCRLDGSMSGVARDASIRQFNNDPETTVILVSLMAGGVGLNLTIASQVHLMEPHWNPMIEEQALERVHRIGQENDVQIFRYLVKDSFESSIIELQTKKLGVARLGMEKLTKEDLRVQKLKEIRALFN